MTIIYNVFNMGIKHGGNGGHYMAVPFREGSKGLGKGLGRIG